MTTKKTDMSFSVTRDGGDFEWVGSSLAAVFAQRWSALSRRRWRLLFDVIRFNQFALDVLIDEVESEQSSSDRSQNRPARFSPRMSIGAYLDQEGYSQTFMEDYLLPMTAMIWSMTPDKCSGHFPASTLIRFMWNHRLLNTIAGRPDWFTVPGGTNQYIKAVMKDFPQERVHLNSKVTAVIPEFKGKVTLRVNGADSLFDHVILATHGDQALDMLKPAATKEELEVLSGFKTSHNIAVLHSDLSLMPQRRVTWSAWNFITESPFPPTHTSKVSKTCLTYWMNLLQHIDESESGPVLVTLNPLHPPRPELTQGVWEYSHPSYDAQASRSRTLLSTIQNRRGVSYCGAWTKYGFREDGFSSGLAAAQEHLGARLPFEFVDSTLSRGRKPVLTRRNHAARLLIRVVQLLILVVATFLGIVRACIERTLGKPKVS